MSAAEVLQAIADSGVTLTVAGDRIRYRGRRSVITPELLKQLTEHKEGLLALLAGANGARTCPDPERSDGPGDGELPHPVEYTLVPDIEAAKQVASELALEAVVGVDLESYVVDPSLSVDPAKPALDPHNARIRLLQISTVSSNFIFDTHVLGLEETIQALKGVLEGPSVIKVVHNSMFDGKFLLAQGVVLAPVFDTQMMDQLIVSATVPDYQLRTAKGPKDRKIGMRGLQAVAKAYLGVWLDKTRQDNYWGGPLSVEDLEYAVRDSMTLLPLHAAMREWLRKLNLLAVADLENKAVLVMVEVAFYGVWLDHQALTQIIDGLKAEKVRLEALLKQEAVAVGATYIPTNWGSTDQRQRFLNELLGTNLTSTAKLVLQSLRVENDSPIIPILQEYLAASGPVSRYGSAERGVKKPKGWLRWVSKVTGRVHADWNPLGCDTGRQSCSNPPLQQIPRDSVYRAMIRPAPVWIYVKGDYPQLELRLGADFSGDVVMSQALTEEGRDIHLEAGAIISGKDVRDLNEDSPERQYGKTANYSLEYGAGSERFWEQGIEDGISWTLEEADTARTSYFEGFAGLRRWQQRQGKVAMSVTRWGRKRNLAEPPESEESEYSAYTKRLNSPIQGTGADGLKLALVELWNTRTPELADCHPVLVTHDEIVIECPLEKRNIVTEWLRNAMVVGMNQVLLKLPFKPSDIEIKACRNYAGGPLEDADTTFRTGQGKPVE
jgi:DNA polymerase-1